MIGYYVHHHGRGHLHRALGLAGHVPEPVTVLSSIPPAPGAPVPWVQLERDDASPVAVGPTAGDRLHWAPLGDEGLRRRMRRISDWLDDVRPRLLVADVSVEVALLARLHGIPVVGIVLPGRREDAPHRLGFDVCERLVGLWPAGLTDLMLPGAPPEVRGRVEAIGALARVPVVRPVRHAEQAGAGRRRATLMLGAGGHDLDPAAVDHAVASTPDWAWTVLDGRPGRWVEDPWPAVRDADVVVCHAGQNAVAEVAAARRPAVLLPQARPYDEQLVTAAALADGRWPALVEHDFPAVDWPARLAEAASLDGSRWSGWCDGRAAERFAALVAAEPAHPDRGHVEDIA